MHSSLLSSSYTFHNILYNTPNKYLSPGTRTQVTHKEWLEEVESNFPKHENSIQQLTKISNWISKRFSHMKKDEDSLATLTVDQIYESKVWRGCHDIAHLFAATVRLIGYPAILVETVSVVWAKEYAKNSLIKGPKGHNLVEVYVQDKWILFDPYPSAQICLEEYDAQNPYIPITHIYDDEPEGFYAIAKGKDAWDSGICSIKNLMELQEKAALENFKDYLLH